MTSSGIFASHDSRSLYLYDLRSELCDGKLMENNGFELFPPACCKVGTLTN